MFIDGVFSGGGIKGFALIGAYDAIETKGFKFKRLAGTSAGSIIAALIAANYTSEEIYGLMSEMELTNFLDERKTIVPLRFSKWLMLYWRLGLYKGNRLEAWMEEKLATKGIRTFGDMPAQSLRIVASDLSSGRMIVLPDDLDQYGMDPLTFPIAKAVRMSCSLPYFFEPVKLKTNNDVSLIVDGGVLSNFPMWLFDKENIKQVRPVLGVKLSHQLLDRPQRKIKNAIQLYQSLFETMKDAHDARYISRKHAKNIIFIQTKGVLTTEFSLSEEKKQELYHLGKESALQFLKGWTY